jgi:hypothetical protein
MKLRARSLTDVIAHQCGKSLDLKRFAISEMSEGIRAKQERPFIFEWALFSFSDCAQSKGWTCFFAKQNPAWQAVALRLQSPSK